MADVALGAVNLVLQLVGDEARLLGSVRDDVQFILDELESMTGLLRHLVVNCRGRAANDHQVRVWMKQIVDFAFDYRNCVRQYPQLDSEGDDGRLLSRLRWLYPSALASRHRIAIEIQKLKARAREIGERQQRYGVAVQSSDVAGDVSARRAGTGVMGRRPELGAPQTLTVEEFKRAILSWPDVLTEQTHELVQWLQLPEDSRRAHSMVAVVWEDDADGVTLVNQVYEHYRQQQRQRSQEAAAPPLFDYVLRITIRLPPIIIEFENAMLNELRRCQLQDQGYISHQYSRVDDMWDDEEQLKEKLKQILRGKRLLLVVPTMDYVGILLGIQELLGTLECSSGSVVVFSTSDADVAGQISPAKAVFYSHIDFKMKKASLLVSDPENYMNYSDLREVFKRSGTDGECTKMFLSSLYYSPHRSAEELDGLSESLENCSNTSEKEYQMVRFCYQGLRNSYKNCLWYSTVFSRGMPHPHVSAPTMARRWVAQGLINQEEDLSALDQSQRCLDALCTQRLLLPHKVGAAGRVKRISVNPLVTSIIDEDIPAFAELLLTNQLPLDDLDLVCSIRHEFHLMVTQAQQGNTTGRQSMDVVKKIVMKFLRNPPAASARLLRVLDLQGYSDCDLDKGHLNNICKIDQLTFLSLRDTNVAELPKQIGRLTRLQTLDIRQTRIKVLKAVLPKLKYLLVGRIDCPGNDAATVKSKESFSTIRMPNGVPAGSMDKLEILSDVWVSDSGKELANIGEKLKQLRKLGVVLCGGSRANIRDLFVQINELHSTLRSMSIRMEPMGRWGTMEAVLTTPPMLLESLRICGVRDWLPSRIKELDNLAKVTLRDTLLNAEALGVLGALKGLRWLRLRYHSFDAGVLTFGGGSFPGLTDLFVEDDIVLTIAFAPEAAPKLANIAWSFQRMESLLGIKNLGSLKAVNFIRLAGNGATNEYLQLQQQVNDHPNKPTFDCQPINPMDGQGATY